MDYITGRKLDKLYNNSVSTWLLQIYKNDLIQYKNEILTNNLHLHLRVCDSEPSYHCPYQITQ